VDIDVSVEDSLYPPPVMGYFDERSMNVLVYLSVEHLPMKVDTEAWVERIGADSIFSLFFGSKGGLELSSKRKITREKRELGYRRREACP
jgi:hypothetical protein